MKMVWLILLIEVGVSNSPAQAQAGLTGEYFKGTNFDTKVATRIDPQISFNWRGLSPVAGIGESYFSVRWTGKLYAPVTGQYVFSAVVDDGIRVWVGNRNVINAWALHDDDSFTGSVVLEAGKYYDLRVDYFNDMLEGKINLFWHRPDDPNRGAPTAYHPIDAQFLYRKVPPPTKPVVLPPRPAAKPVVAATTRSKPKPVPKPVAMTVATAKPVAVVNKPAAVPPAAPAPKPADETFEHLEVGKPLVLQSVFFEQSTYVLLPASFPELDKLVRTLTQNPTVRISIGGHTDNVGDPRLNQSLSEFRARVVMNYLTRHGIADSRVEAQGYGGSRPVAGNTTDAERAQNRRVEFVVK